MCIDYGTEKREKEKDSVQKSGDNIATFATGYETYVVSLIQAFMWTKSIVLRKFIYIIRARSVAEFLKLCSFVIGSNQHSEVIVG